MDDSVQGLMKDFLEEAFAHVDALEAWLLKLEDTPDNMDAIKEIFRSAHTIKGGAGTVGFMEIQELTHIMEDVLDLVRQGQMSLTQPDVSLLLQVRDELAAMLNARDQDSVWESGMSPYLMEQLQRMKSQTTPQNTPPLSIPQAKTDLALPLPFVLDATAIEAIQSATDQGQPLWVATYNLNADSLMRDVAPVQILSLLQSKATVIAMNPSLERYDTAFSPRWRILFTAPADLSPDFFRQKTCVDDLVHDVVIESYQVPSQAQPVAPISQGAMQPASTLLDPAEWELEIAEHLFQGSQVFILTYQFDTENPMREVASYQVHSLLKDIGEIMAIFPELGVFHPQMEVLFAANTAVHADWIREKTLLKELVTQLDIQPYPQADTPAPQITVPSPTPTLVPIQQPAMEELQHAQASLPQASLPQAAPTSPPPNNATETEKQRSVSSIRVESKKIDDLLNLLGELVITKASFAQNAQSLEQATAYVRSAMKNFLGGIQYLELEKDPDLNHERNALLLKQFQTIFQSFDVVSENIQKLNHISSALQENVMQMRMVPIQMVFSRFPRLIRDIANKVQKKIELHIEGVDTEIDKGMVDDIFDPLIHILRNAMDHGIEPPSERILQGKPETGNIVLRAYQEGNNIIISISDDGKGINPKVVAQKAVEKGLISPEHAQNMSDKEAINMVFLPGFSTAAQVTDLSGRGVGMDVVRSKIEDIGGNVSITSTLGKGSTITIRLPLTMAIIQGLLIVINDMYYIIPVASIEETLIISSEDMRISNHHLNLDFRGKLIPILPLENIFYGKALHFLVDTDPPPMDDDSHPRKEKRERVRESCIVVRFGERLIGLMVSEIIGEQDIVVKPLNTHLIKSPGISSATIVGDGRIGFIIESAQFVEHYLQQIGA